MKNQKPAQVDDDRPEEDNTSESKDSPPSPVSDRTQWLGEEPPTHMGDLETPLLESESCPTGEVDQAQDARLQSVTTTMTMGWMGQVLASIVTMSDSRERIETTIGITTLLMVGFAIAATCRFGRTGAKVGSSILTVWWFVGANLIDGEWAENFACWGGLVSSVVTLLAILRSDLKADHLQLVPYVFLAGVEQVWAAIKYLAMKHRHESSYPGRTIFALVVGGLTLLAAIAVQFSNQGKKIPISALRVGVFLFAVLWMTLILVVTVVGPFSDGRDGFWSAWSGFLLLCFWLARLSIRGGSDSVEASKRNLVIWLIGQALAAVLILVESTSQQRLAGHRPERYLTTVIALITLLLVSFGLRMMYHEGTHCLSITVRFGGTSLTTPQIAAGGLMLWWFCWASVFTTTTFGPPNPHKFYDYDEDRWRSRPHWTGFVACWGGVVCSIAAMMSSVTVEPEGRQGPFQQEKVVPYIILASVVQILAVVQALFTPRHIHKYGGMLIYALVVSALTVVAIAIQSLIPTSYQLSRTDLVMLFTLLWTALAFTTTIVGPFSGEIPNGFWSAWCGCLLFWFWLCRLVQHVFSPLSKILLEGRRE